MAKRVIVEGMMTIVKKKLRELKDQNLSVIIRSYQHDDGDIFYTVQKTAPVSSDKLYMERPMYAHICLTNSCNLQCPYCYANDNRNQADMKCEEILKLIDLCVANGVMEITWTGGEPFMREDLMKILWKTHDAGIHQTILTNGTCIPDGFIENGPHDNIQYQISLNEAWSHTQYNIEKHNKIYSVLRQCTKLGVKNVLSIILEVREEKEIEQLIGELIENQVKNVRFGYLMPVGKCNNTNYSKYIKEIKNNIPLYCDVRERHLEEINIFFQFDKALYSEQGIPRRLLMCEAGTTEMYIDNNGDVYPCPLFKSEREFYCGNVFKNNWEELWMMEPMNRFRAIKECDNCSYNCKVWCRGLKYFYDGELEGKSLFCLKSINRVET